MEKYNPAKIEKKWQKKWSEKKIYAVKESDKKAKFYALDMFPYPSGEGLHVGHPKGYIATDVVSRYERMHGKVVLHPMGFDAFGLPAENYAIKTKTNPAVAVAKNVARYKKQLEILGFDYDWSREVNTTDPNFYKWTQWIFLQMYKKGLAYESNEPVNWCPKDKTVLANEDVENGVCERCGTPVEKKSLRQWVLKITDYADRLIADLDASEYEMPKLVDKVNSHQPGKPVVRRRVAHAIVYDPKQKKYLIIRNKKFGWDTVIIGGVEQGEDPIDTAMREVKEETGYTDIEFKRVLGGQTEAHYYTKHKGENRIANAEAIYFELKSDKREAVAEGEDKDNEILWVDEKDFVPGKMVNSELSVWLARLKDANAGWPKPLLNWPESIKEAQRNWIGRSEGVKLKFKVKDLDITFEMYDSIPQTFMAQTFTVIAPEHKSVYELVKNTEYEKSVMEFVESIKSKKSLQTFDHLKDMEGIFTGRYIEYGPANRLLPIWVASYALADYGSGVVNCSAHDERDYIFAKKYNIPLHPVLFPEDKDLAEKVRNQEVFYREANGILSEPAEFKGRRWGEVREDIINYIVEKGWGSRSVQYRLRDWVFSRQRYWGEPIPVVHCMRCAVKERKSEAKVSLSFYDIKTWQNLIKGKKTFETRALNPEEKDRYFGDIGVGDTVLLALKDKKSKKVKDEILVKIVSKNTYKGFAELLNDKANLEKLGEGKFKNLKALEKKYSYTKDYPDIIRQNGLVGWQIEIITTVRAVPEKNLPVKLPKVKSYEPTGTGESPLAAIESWVNTKCPSCGGPAKRETNTMPQWAGSSWYYLRYEDPKNKNQPVDEKKEKFWSPVDLYVGGAEHATRHLIYARFWHKFLYDVGVVSEIEPFKKLQNVGLIMGEDGRKMSKRFGNVVNPDEIVKIYGADTLRIYEMFMGPFDQQIAWSTNSMVGSRRFIERVWKLCEKLGENRKKITKNMSGNADEKTVLGKNDLIMHRTIKKVTDDIAALRFNTAISSLMIATNELEKAEMLSREQYENLLKLLAPFAPHFTEELWLKLGNKNSIHLASWPKYDEMLMVADQMSIVIQVNGKVRANFMVDVQISDEELKRKATELPEIQKWIAEKSILKIIIIKGRLINIVVQ